jgi:hypothetical protein
MLFHFFKMPKKIQLTPARIHNILLIDSLSAIPNSPIVVVDSKINGPITASPELINSAFSTWLKRIISKAAITSKLPESTLKLAILITNLFINCSPPFFQRFYYYLMQACFILGVLGTASFKSAYADSSTLPYNDSEEIHR